MLEEADTNSRKMCKIHTQNQVRNQGRDANILRKTAASSRGRNGKKMVSVREAREKQKLLIWRTGHNRQGEQLVL